MDEFKVRSGRPDDIPEVLEVIDRSFHHRYYGGLKDDPEERDLFDHLYHRDDFDPSWLVVGEVGGRIVSVVGAFPRPAYLAGAILASWVLSPAATLLEYRGRGYMFRLITELQSQVTARGGTLLFFHGVPDYYPRLGFARCIPRYETVLATGAAAGQPGIATASGAAGPPLRPARPDEAPALAALWDGEAIRGCLAMVRTPDWWRRELNVGDVARAKRIERPFPDHADLLVLAGGEPPRAYAYATERNGRLWVSETAAADDPAAAELLAAIRRRAAERGLTELAIRGEPGRRLSQAAIRALGSFRVIRADAGFAKVLAPYPLLKSLEPVLSARWTDRGADGVGTLALDLDGDFVSLVHDPEGVTVARVDWRPPVQIGIEALTRLVLGYVPPGQDLLSGLTLSRAARHVLAILFPPAHPDPGDYTF